MSPEPTSNPSAQDGALHAFLGALFPLAISGVPEVRAIDQSGGGLPPECVFFDTASDLADAIPKVAEEARNRGLGLFFGVLPRRESGRGTSADTLPGMALWADIDFKDYAGNEKEARERIAAFPLQPSIIVRTGHGLHLYWLLSEPTEPALIQRLNQRIARVLGADHAFDAARVLRLPGTWNVKDPAHPILVEIERLDAE